MNLEELRQDIMSQQKKGLPYIIGSVIIWALIAIVSALDLPVMTRNMLTFCCACPLLPIAWVTGKLLKVDIFSKQNPLGNLGFLFTMNQILYLLTVRWVYGAVPDKMVMVYAMVFGAHLLPYSWLYKSKAYMIFAIAIPFIALALGLMFNSLIISCSMIAIEIVFVILLFQELK